MNAWRALSLLFLLSPALAAAGDPCIDYCLSRADEAKDVCATEACDVSPDDVFEVCFYTCDDEVKIPKTSWLMDFADREAAERFGQVERIDTQEYLLPNGELGGYMVVYRAAGTRYSRSSVLRRLDKDPDADLSSWLFGLHIGAHVTQPPVLAAWNDAPPEYRAIARGRQALFDAYGVTAGDVKVRYGTPLQQVLGFDVGAEVHFYDTRSGGVATELTPRSTRPSQETLVRHEAIRRLWLQTLDLSNHN